MKAVHIRFNVIKISEMELPILSSHFALGFQSYQIFLIDAFLTLAELGIGVVPWLLLPSAPPPCSVDSNKLDYVVRLFKLFRLNRKTFKKWVVLPDFLL